MKPLGSYLAVVALLGHLAIHGLCAHEDGQVYEHQHHHEHESPYEDLHNPSQAYDSYDRFYDKSHQEFDHHRPYKHDKDSWHDYCGEGHHRYGDYYRPAKRIHLKCPPAPPPCPPPLVASDKSGPAADIGVSTQRHMRTAADPQSSTPAPTAPYRALTALRSSSSRPQAGITQVCAANPAYTELAPDKTVCKFFLNAVVNEEAYSSSCTAWFIEPNLMVTAGHCVTLGAGMGYFLTPENPGFICCSPDHGANTCLDSAKFKILAWVTTKGFYEGTEPVGEASNDGAVLLVEPALGNGTIQPEPLATATFNNVGSSIPPLSIATSGYPCSNIEILPQYEGCTVDNGLDKFCAVRRGYILDDALPILNTNRVDGNVLTYKGSSCNGHSGGPLSAPDNGIGAFGILVAGPTVDCTLPGGTSGSTYTQIVDRKQEHGVYVDALAAAVLGVHTRPVGAADGRVPAQHHAQKR